MDTMAVYSVWPSFDYLDIEQKKFDNQLVRTVSGYHLDNIQRKVSVYIFLQIKGFLGSKLWSLKLFKYPIFCAVHRYEFIL
jgi:hypothetical protein